MSFSVLASPLGLLLAFAALSVLIIIHEGGHYLVAKWSGMRVDRFQIFFGQPILKWQRGETTYAVGYIPFGGFVQIAGLNPDEPTLAGPDDPRLYGNRPVYQRFLTIFAGPATNYIFAAFTMVFVFLVFGLPTPADDGPPVVTMVVKDSPADGAGVRLEDRVQSIAGKKVKSTLEVQTLVAEAKETPIEIVLDREGTEKRVTVTPRKEGEFYRIGVGIDPPLVWKRASFGTAVAEGLRAPYELSRRQLAGIAAMITKKQKPDFTGPAGIVSYMKKQILQGPAEGLQIVAIISTLLGLFNLLPLPALDGGRLVFITFEAITRRKFPQRVEQTVHLVGMLALLSFLLYVTVFKDVPRLFLGH